MCGRRISRHWKVIPHQGDLWLVAATIWETLTLIWPVQIMAAWRKTSAWMANPLRITIITTKSGRRGKTLVHSARLPCKIITLMGELSQRLAYIAAKPSQCIIISTCKTNSSIIMRVVWPQWQPQALSIQICALLLICISTEFRSTIVLTYRNRQMSYKLRYTISGGKSTTWRNSNRTWLAPLCNSEIKVARPIKDCMKLLFEGVASKIWVNWKTFNKS